MTHANGWPDKERPGYPMFPEREGYHWLAGNGRGAPFPARWAKEAHSDGSDKWIWDWCDGFSEGVSPKATSRFSYLGPCPTPDELTALLRSERERCAKVCEEIAGSFEKDAQRTVSLEASAALGDQAATCRDLSRKIRNLPDEPPCTPS